MVLSSLVNELMCVDKQWLFHLFFHLQLHMHSSVGRLKFTTDITLDTTALLDQRQTRGMEMH